MHDDEAVGAGHTRPEQHSPFAVLELGADATAMDVERQKQKLLGMLELGIQSALFFEKAGTRVARDAEMVREAADALLDSKERWAWQLWEADASDAPQLAHARDMHRAFASDVEAGAALADELGEAWALVFDGGVALDYVADSAPLELAHEICDAFETEVLRQMSEAFARMPAFNLDEVHSHFAWRAIDAFVEARAERLGDRANELRHAADPASDEVRSDWKQLRRDYQALCKQRGASVSQRAFHAVYVGLSNYGVNLHRVACYEPSAEVFQWLVTEAQRAGDVDACEHERSNYDSALQAMRQERADRQREAQKQRGRMTWIAVKVALVVLVLVVRTSGCPSTSSSRYRVPDISLPSYAPPPFVLPEFVVPDPVYPTPRDPLYEAYLLGNAYQDPITGAYVLFIDAGVAEETEAPTTTP